MSDDELVASDVNPRFLFSNVSFRIKISEWSSDLSTEIAPFYTEKSIVTSNLIVFSKWYNILISFKYNIQQFLGLLLLVQVKKKR